MIVKIVKIGNEYIYPIFKNGSSGIDQHIKKHGLKYLINDQCSRAKKITVYIREPRQRFVSGVNQFIALEKEKFEQCHEETILHLIKNKKLNNEHFEQQFFWLWRLQKFCDPVIKLKPLAELDLPITNKSAISRDVRNKILNIYDCPHDEILYHNFIGKETSLSELLKEVGNAVS